MSTSTTIVGNVTADPTLKYTPGGSAVANFSVACSRRWQNKQTQEWEEATSFLNVVCWRELAENVSESVEKGARVIVTGRLDQRSWETPDGEKRSVIEIVADEVGPSLKYATASVMKAERREGGASGDYPKSTPAPLLPDEEPF